MGAYDEEEHERRERKASNVDASSDDERTEYRGQVEYEGDESTEQLLDQFKQIQQRGSAESPSSRNERSE